MSQQINLYQEQFRPRTTPCSARQIGALAALLALVLGGWVALERQALAQRTARLVEARSELTRWGAQVAALEARVAEEQAVRQRVERLNRVRAELSAKREVLRYFERLQGGARPQFSEYLEALARRNLRGMWLTSIEIGSGGAQLRLAGSALEARLVPDFLFALSGEGAYAGRTFSSMLVNRPQDEAWRVDFVLSTRGAEKGS